MIQNQNIPSSFRELKKSRNAFSMLLLGLMWAVPYNLIAPYFSLYMAGLGCSSDQIGLLSTVGMVFQAVFSLFAAPVTDRLGRKRTTLIFDMIGWSGSMLILALAQNFYWFLIATRR